MEDVPGLRDTLLSLGTSVDVQASSKAHEGHVLARTPGLADVVTRQSVMGTYGGNISESLVLFASTRNGQEEDENPWDADLSPHLEADRSDSGVKGSTHEVVVEKVA